MDDESINISLFQVMQDDAMTVQPLADPSSQIPTSFVALMTESERKGEHFNSHNGGHLYSSVDSREADSKPLFNHDEYDFGLGTPTRRLSGFSGLTKLQEALLKPLPLIPKGSAYQEGLDIPRWRQKNTALLKSVTSVKKSDMSLNVPVFENKELDASIVVAPEPDEEGDDPDQKVKTVEQVQEKLSKYAESIPIQCAVQIDLDSYPRYFKYPVYESYKPGNLQEAKKLLQLYVRQSSHSPPLDADYYKDYISYLKKELNTRFPSYVNEKKLLQFDSNFECGNLDSAYVVNENEYNLLMKVDTNTKGSSFWFFFRVRGNWKQPRQEGGRVIKFNIVNFTKADIKNFYQNGMNIRTRVNDEGQWHTGKCFDIEFFQNQDIERGLYGGGQLFYQLSFKFNFTFANYTEDGPAVSFAYCLPYSYSDMLTDLSYVKMKLLESPDATITYLSGDQSKRRNSTITEGGEEKVETPLKQGQKVNESIVGTLPNQPADRAKLNQYELQHIEIRNRGLKVIKLNSIEKAIFSDPPINEQLQDSKERLQMDPVQVDAVLGQEFEVRTPHVIMKQEIICRSMGGLPIYQLTMQSPQARGDKRKRKVIYITARAHAGETHSSVVMQKLIHELCLSTKANDKSKYEALFQAYVVKLVPMINVDGVVIGNARTSLIGLDLNRRWTQPNPLVHPEVYFLKKEMLKAQKAYDGIQIFCDLHGHNKNPNAFVYGCHKAANQGLLSWTKTRLLPKIIAAMTPIFDFKECRFKIDRCKLNTARVVCWNELKITNSFTLEVSMYGKLLQIASCGAKELSPRSPMSQDHLIKPTQQIVQFEQRDLHQVATSLLQAMTHYNTIEPELEQEFQQTGGWLKVQTLNSMAGKTARDRIEESLKGRKAKKRMLKNTQDVGKKHSQPISSSQSPTKNTSQPKALTSEKQGQKTVQTQSNFYRHKTSGLPKEVQKLEPLQKATPYLLSQAHQQQEPNPQANSVSSGIFGMSLGKQRGRTLHSRGDNSPHETQQTTTQPLINQLSDHQLRRGYTTAVTPTQQHISHKAVEENFSFNWRDFFDSKELGIVIGGGKTSIMEEEWDEESSEQEAKVSEKGSDSDPSEDNMDPAQFLEIIETAFKGDEDVNFKELHGGPQQIQTPTGKLSPIKERYEEHNQETTNDMRDSFSRTFHQTSQIREQDEDYNFILKSGSRNNSIQAEVSRGTSPKNVGKWSISKAQANLRQDSQDMRDNRNEAAREVSSHLSYKDQDPAASYARQKSPITYKPSSNLYAGLSQSKQSHRSTTNQEKLRQIQKLSKLRTSTQSQRQQPPIQQKSNLFDPLKQRIFTGLKSGARVQESEKPIFSSSKHGVPIVQSHFTHMVTPGQMRNSSPGRTKEAIKSVNQATLDNYISNLQPVVNIVITENTSAMDYAIGESIQNAILAGQILKDERRYQITSHSGQQQIAPKKNTAFLIQDHAVDFVRASIQENQDILEEESISQPIIEQGLPASFVTTPGKDQHWKGQTTYMLPNARDPHALYLKAGFLPPGTAGQSLERQVLTHNYSKYQQHTQSGSIDPSRFKRDKNSQLPFIKGSIAGTRVKGEHTAFSKGNDYPLSSAASARKQPLAKMQQSLDEAYFDQGHAPATIGSVGRDANKTRTPYYGQQDDDIRKSQEVVRISHQMLNPQYVLGRIPNHTLYQMAAPKEISDQGKSYSTIVRKSNVLHSAQIQTTIMQRACLDNKVYSKAPPMKEPEEQVTTSKKPYNPEDHFAAINYINHAHPLPKTKQASSKKLLSPEKKYTPIKTARVDSKDANFLQANIRKTRPLPTPAMLHDYSHHRETKI